MFQRSAEVPGGVWTSVRTPPIGDGQKNRHGHTPPIGDGQKIRDLYTPPIGDFEKIRDVHTPPIGNFERVEDGCPSPQPSPLGGIGHRLEDGVAVGRNDLLEDDGADRGTSPLLNLS